jgi:hypothetical protein
VASGLTQKKAVSTASSLRRPKSATKKPPGNFETAARPGDGGTWDVYARYLGPARGERAA